MFFQVTALSASLLYLATAQTPPGFSPETNVNLAVNFPTPADIDITPGLLVPQPDTLTPPGIKASPSNATGDSYFLTMLDLDTSLGNQTHIPFLHWMAQSLTSGTNNLTAAPSSKSIVATYIEPYPPPGTGKHTYVILLFNQPANFIFPKAYAYLDPPVNATLRINFQLDKFVEAAGLGQPVAATYWLETFPNGTTNGTASATGSPTSSTGSAAPSTSAFTGGSHRIEAAGLGFGVVGLLFALTFF